MSMAQERISSQRNSLEQLTCMLCNIAATAHASQGTVRLYTGDFALQHFAVIFPRSATPGTCVSQKCVTDIPYLSDLGYVQVPKASLWGMPILVVSRALRQEETIYRNIENDRTTCSPLNNTYRGPSSSFNANISCQDTALTTRTP